MPGLEGVTSLAAGDGTACVAANGMAYCWGNGASGELGGGVIPTGNTTDTLVQVALVPNVASVSIGNSTGCATTTAGEVWCWGDNSSGQLGTGSVGGFTATPARVNLPATTAVSTGLSQSCAVTNAGLMCWGLVGLASVGDGGVVPTPTLITW